MAFGAAIESDSLRFNPRSNQGKLAFSASLVLDLVGNVIAAESIQDA
jgi:hypothetical protein